MKKISTCLIALIFSLTTIFVSQPVMAAGTVVNVSVSGEIRKGNSIEIAVDLENALNLYGGDIKFFYDKYLLKIESIAPNRDIISENLMQYNEPDDGGKARFYFTMRGDVEGYSGSANFIRIKATVLKDGDLSLDTNNLFLQLVKKAKGKNPENMDFTLNMPGNEPGNESEVKPEDNNSNKGNDNSENTDDSSNSDFSNAIGNSTGNSFGNSMGNGIGNSISNSNENKDSDETNKDDTEDKVNSKENLNTNDEKDLVAGKKEKDDDSKDSKNYVIYGVIVVVLLGGIGIYTYIKRKKDK